MPDYWDDMREVVRRLKGLLDDPQHGLMTWNLMLAHAIRDFRTLTDESEKANG